MLLRCIRLLRRAAVEVGIFLCGGGLGWFLVGEDEPTWAAVVGALAAAAGMTGLVFLWRRGELALALRCPRLDALGVKPGARAAPWEVLDAAEAALDALAGDAKRFEHFFETARSDIAKAARRAVELQTLRLRAQRALAHAPVGDARQALEDQTQRAERELGALKGLLGELRARFIVSTAPLHAVEDPMPALQALEQRSDALGQALNKVRGNG